MRNRIFRILSFTLTIIFSLLAFPGAFPIVILSWVAFAFFAWRTNRPRLSAAAIALTTVLTILKGPFVPALVGYGAVALSSSLVIVVRPSHQKTWLAMTLVATAAIVFSVDRYLATVASTRPIDNIGAVACLGDSLTSGLPSTGGYPHELKQLIRNTVHDLGREGITADEALPLLDEIPLSQTGYVIIELGGHDFLKKQSRESTKSDLACIIERCQMAGCHVLLCEVPRGFIIDPYFGLERELAREYDLDLMPDSMIRKLVLFSPYAPPGLWMPKRFHYSDDGLHPNAAGNRMLARHLALRLKLPSDER